MKSDGKLSVQTLTAIYSAVTLVVKLLIDLKSVLRYVRKCG